MSFQDVQRRRQHPIFDNHRRASSSSNNNNAGPKISLSSTRMEKEYKPVQTGSEPRQSLSQQKQQHPQTQVEVASSTKKNKKISLSSTRMEKEYKPVQTGSERQKSQSQQKQQRQRQPHTQVEVSSNTNKNKKISLSSTRMEKEYKPVQTGSERRQSQSQQKQQRQPQTQVEVSSNINKNKKISLSSTRMEKEYVLVSAKAKKTQQQQPSQPQRGVRPRLSTSCPVTQKYLLVDDHESMSTQETIDTLSSQEEYDNPAILPIRSRKNRTSPKSQSIFANLTDSIVNYQKMVAELESLVQDAGASPELQWRTRILIRSAQDADQDIQTRLYQLDESQHSSSRAQVALRKLHRDFGRVHQNLLDVLQSYQRQQQVEVSFLNHMEGDETKEEFFDRAMREREEEVNEIHTKMNQVNTIYQDLAALVDGQQEQIDKIAEGTEESKANTKDGLHEIRHGFFGLCVPLNGQVAEGDEQQDQPKAGEEGFRVQENFQWSMPFETLADDMRAVHADVIKFGQGMMDDLQDHVMEGPLSGCSQAFDCNHEAS